MFTDSRDWDVCIFGVIILLTIGNKCHEEKQNREREREYGEGVVCKTLMTR